MTASASVDVLRKRAELVRAVRAFFHRRGFWEVETPVWSRESVVDAHLDPVPARMPLDPTSADRGLDGWLQTSPELHMKRLLAAGADAIFQITHAFRAAERGRRHNPEFTIVEWYRVGEGIDEAMTRTSDLAETILGRGPAERVSYRGAFQKYAGVDPLRADVETLADACRRLKVEVPQSLGEDRDAWLDVLLTACVEPHLGRPRPTIVYDYPPSQAALARIRPGDPPVAERFELYVDGIELANGYHELLDPDELLGRIHAANAKRNELGKPTLAPPAHLLAAMRDGLPASCGVALGLDRLVMIALGLDSIDQVLPFPLERA